MQMIQSLIILIPLLLAAFWLWMFNDMLNNGAIRNAGPLEFRWPPAARSQWILLFIVFNVFTAGYYYFTEYKK